VTKPAIEIYGLPFEKVTKVNCTTQSVKYLMSHCLLEWYVLNTEK